MKAVVFTEFGSPDVLHLKEIDQPAPKDNEILIKIMAVPVGTGDLMARNFKRYTPRTFNMPGILLFLSRLQFGFRKPKMQILGSELSGEVVAVGKDVTRFTVGDEVYAYPGAAFGAYAEYRTMKEKATVALKPSNLTHEEACAVPYGAVTAMLLLRKVNIQPGQKVLVNGASGTIGAAAVQLAKHYGAEVSGVCSTPRVEMVKALGADHVIDYTQEDFKQRDEKYDVVFDILGRGSFAKVKNVLTPKGRYLLASFKMDKVFQMLRTAFGGGQKVICALAMESSEDLEAVTKLVEEGVIKPVIDKRFPLEQAADAHRYAESGQKTGSIILTLDHLHEA